MKLLEHRSYVTSLPLCQFLVSHPPGCQEKGGMKTVICLMEFSFII